MEAQTSGTCPRCGTALTPDVPQGLCPKCLLAAAVPPGDSVGLDALGVASAIGAASEALTGDASAAETISSAPAHEEAGSSIGRYKMLEKIGEGGMGVVYMAEQQRPVVRRVAIKIIKLGMDTHQVIARFEAERQALAMMDHPNIARVLDAGATETGRPYFVMELVHGVSITEYCDTNNLTTRQRLELFVPICRAVQHAHQKGIIHRDLKPSNVLITMHDGVPVPKVIDFGVAKATGGRLTDKTLFTEYHQFVGTPEYMSPEQAEMSGLDIDTRADVYALGVLLYELLTGTTPFDGKALRKAAYAEIQRIIREVEPPKPSTRLSTLGETLTKVAACRGSDPKKLGALMRGDLDWIVMKCLEKDRIRRYETANELAAEIERHLKNETVLARPTSARYRMRKFMRRHRVGVTAAAAIAVTLVLGIFGTTYGLVRAKNETTNAKNETQRATREANKAVAVTDFVQEMLSSADPMKTSRNDITVRQIVDAAARKLDSGELRTQPGVESAVRLTLGVTYRGLGKNNESEVQLRNSLALATQVYGPESPEVASVLASLGSTCAEQQRPEALEMLRQSLKIRQKRFGTDSTEVARSLHVLAGALHGFRVEDVKSNNNDAAEAYAREALRICRLRHDDKLAAKILTNLGNELRAKRAFAESLAMHREATDLYCKRYGENSYEASLGWLGQGNTLLNQCDFHACDVLMTRALDIRRKIFAANHPVLRGNLIWLADVRLRRREYPRAAELLLEAYNSLPPGDKDEEDNEYERKTVGRPAHLYDSWGNQPEAERWREAWAGLMRARVARMSAEITAKRDDPTLYRSRATAYSSLGQFDRAAFDLAEAIRIDPSDYRDWLQRASLLAYLKDDRAYKEHCRVMLNRFGGHEKRWVRESVARFCLLMPQSSAEMKHIAAVVESAAVAETDSFLWWFQATKGLAEYRLGHYQAAIGWCSKGRANFTLEERIQAELVIAMSHCKLGLDADGEAVMSEAADQIEKDLPQLGKGDINETDTINYFAVNGWLVCRILFREANDLILPSTPTTQPLTAPLSPVPVNGGVERCSPSPTQRPRTSYGASIRLSVHFFISLPRRETRFPRQSAWAYRQFARSSSGAVRGSGAAGGTPPCGLRRRTCPVRVPPARSRLRRRRGIP